MNALEIADDWNITRSKFKQNLMKLTVDDLTCVECELDKQVRNIQQRTGEPIEVVANAIMELVFCGSSPAEFQF
jgi:hypothetical protein